MPDCKHCGVPIEILPGPHGRKWFHLSDRSIWCHTTTATPARALPTSTELDELLDQHWSKTEIADLYGTTRDRLNTILRRHKNGNRA